MFRRIDNGTGETVEFDFEGETLRAREGETVAAALLAAGRPSFRDTPERGRPRGPFCMMGVCFDCLIEIDGQPNRQACQVRVRPDMKVRRQKGAPAIGPGDGSDP